MNLRQAAQQALEAWFRPHGINYVDFKPYREALRTALAEPEQEPDGISWLKRDSGYFTAPTPRKPLTDEEMRECAQAMNAEPLAEGWPELIKFARAIENKHGIGEQHE